MEKEYIVNKTSSLSINVVATEVESLRKVDETTSTVRVYENGYIGVAGQIGDENIDALEAQAVENLSSKIEYPCQLTQNETKNVDSRKHIVDTEHFVKVARDLLATLKTEVPDFLFSNKIQYHESETSYRNSQNTSLYYAGNEMDLVICIKSKASANIMDFAYAVAVDEYDKQKAVADIKALCEAYLNDVPLEDGKYTVVAEQSLFYGNCVDHLAGESYATGASLFKDKLGQRILSDKLTIELDRTNNLNLAFFDAEGSFAKTDENVLVDKGTFARVLANKKIASTYNLPRVFCSRAAYDSVPVTGGSGLVMRKTADRIEDLLGNEKAIYILDASGGDMTTSGDFATPCQVALLVENGKFVGRVPQINLFGNVKDYLGDDYVGASDRGLFQNKTDLAVAKMNVTKI